MDISVNYMGLQLRSPIIAASSALTSNVKIVQTMERAGVGAIVVKSLFEEQINNEAEFIIESSHDYPEMEDYIHNYLKGNSINEYIKNLRDLKSAVSVPIIASVNCFSFGNWISFAKEIENSGVDAIEINIFDMPFTINRSSEEIEKEYLTVVEGIKKSLKIPISVKIGDHFTNIPSFVHRLKGYGASAVTMFNKFYTPDIDVQHRKLASPVPFSNDSDYLSGIRWTAIVSSLVKNIDISASTGIHTPEVSVKQILSGAKTIQLCSVLYQNGIEVISDFNKYISSYLEKGNFQSVEQMRGLLNYSNVKDPAKYERVQFLKSFGGHR